MHIADEVDQYLPRYLLYVNKIMSCIRGYPRYKVLTYYYLPSGRTLIFNRALTGLT